MKLNDINTNLPLPEPRRPKAKPPTPTPDLTIGSFFAESKALADARKPHLARVGILPEQATALAMPDTMEKPVAPTVNTETLPEIVHASEYKPRKLPTLE